MGFMDKLLKRNKTEEIVVPQYFNKTTDDWEVIEGSYGAFNVTLPGSNVAEQLTQANASSGKVTFLKPVQHLEIYNRDTTNDGIFIVNGITITVPKNEVFKASFGGTPSTQVTITGSTSYILTRYE